MFVLGNKCSLILIVVCLCVCVYIYSCWNFISNYTIGGVKDSDAAKYLRTQTPVAFVRKAVYLQMKTKS